MIKISPSSRFKEKLIKIFTQSSRYCTRQGFCGVLIAAGPPQASPQPRGGNPRLATAGLVPTGISHCPCGHFPRLTLPIPPCATCCKEMRLPSKRKPCTSMGAGLGIVFIHSSGWAGAMKEKHVKTCSSAQHWTAGASQTNPGCGLSSRVWAARG